MSSSPAESRYLEPAKTRFARTEGGFLSLTIGESESFPRVHIYGAFPLSQALEYLSVRDPEDKEIGIIASLDGFPAETVHLLEEELASRYFTPTITKILSVKEEFGYSYWEVETTAGRCRFTIQSGGNGAIPLEAGRLILVDVDGNRFELVGSLKLDAKTTRVLENLL